MRRNQHFPSRILDEKQENKLVYCFTAENSIKWTSEKSDMNEGVQSPWKK